MEYMVYLGHRHRRSFASLAEANTWRRYKRHQSGVLSWFIRVKDDEGALREVSAEEARDTSMVEPRQVLTAMDTTALGVAIDDHGLDGLARYIGVLVCEISVTDGTRALDAAGRAKRLEEFADEAEQVIPLLAMSGSWDALQVVAMLGAMLSRTPRVGEPAVWARP